MADRVSLCQGSDQTPETSRVASNGEVAPAIFLIFHGGQDHELWAGEFCGAFATREAAEATLKRGYGGQVFKWALGPDGRCRGEGQS